MDRRDASSTKGMTFGQKWGDDPFTQSGHTQVPNALITYSNRLGLKSEECWLITCILRFKYDASNPTPSQEHLAEIFGQSVDTIQRTLKKIVSKKLLRVERMRDEETHRFTHTVYDFTPLRFALNECHYQDFPDERPQVPLPKQIKETTDSHTAEMRCGSTGDPHRRNAAWATPHFCGLDLMNKKKAINVKEERALNVRKDEDETHENSTPNAKGKGIYAMRDLAVEEIITLTKDENSKRRFEQVWEIAMEQESLVAWDKARNALKRRLGASSKQGLDRPGAYFCKICVQELEKLEVFIPTQAEKQEGDGVGEIIRQGLFNTTPDLPDDVGGNTDVMPEIQTPARQVKPVASAKEVLGVAAELEALARRGGASYESFLAYVATERKRYEDEIAGMGEGAKKRLLGAFDKPEKQQSLYKKWCYSAVIKSSR
jgi:hypothetical protein